MTGAPLPDPEADFAQRDNPGAEFIEAMRRTFPTERETDELLVRKMHRRAGPPYRRISKTELRTRLERMFNDVLDGPYEISGERWFTGGVSKIQLGFTLAWNDGARGRRVEQMLVRMDPSESHNATSRLREYEVLRAFKGVVPVPDVFWLDEDARWFPEPALVYAFMPGVTKPSVGATGQISGLGTNFGPKLRQALAPQFLEQLVRIHTFRHGDVSFRSMDRPAPNSREGALWQVNRARRLWEEDRGEDEPLMEVIGNWLERNVPVVDKVTFVHGDYRSGNFLFDEAEGRITAWLDWERAHLGDRHRDLAWTAQEIMGHYSEDGRTYYVCGLIPRDEFFARYEEMSGLPVDPERLLFYEVLNGYQILISVIASAYRIVRLGKSHQDVLLGRVRGQAPALKKRLLTLLRDRL